MQRMKKNPQHIRIHTTVRMSNSIRRYQRQKITPKRGESIQGSPSIENIENKKKHSTYINISI